MTHYENLIRCIIFEKCKPIYVYRSWCDLDYFILEYRNFTTSFERVFHVWSVVSVAFYIQLWSNLDRNVSIAEMCPFPRIAMHSFHVRFLSRRILQVTIPARREAPSVSYQTVPKMNQKRLSAQILLCLGTKLNTVVSKQTEICNN